MIKVSKRPIGHPRFRPGSALAYGAAATIVALAIAVRLMLDLWFDAIPFVTFFPGVVLVTLLCGSIAGTLAGAIFLIIAWVFVIPETTLLSFYQTALFSIGTLTVTSVIATMRAASEDIRRSNENLQTSEAQFRSLLEGAPDAMVIVDAQHRIALINAQAEALFGYERTALLGQPVEMLLGEQCRRAYLGRLAALLSGPDNHGTIQEKASGKAPVVDLFAVRRDGSEMPVELSLARLSTGSGLLVSNVIRDVTARRQIEARLLEASKAKSDFLAGMSHELRTPLNAIIGFSEMIRDAVLGPVDARYRGYGADINASGRHLHRIINDILDIAKVESGRMELRDEVVSVAETIEACRRIVAAMAGTAGVTLITNTSGALPVIRSDQVRFQQILLNLMSNAVKFTPAGGRVSVTAAVEADAVVIAVADTGIGMSEADVAVALQPFRQIDGVMSRRFDGTGLGLPLAKALVELHDGQLDIDSVLNVGTTIRICLPLARLANAAA